MRRCWTTRDTLNLCRNRDTLNRVEVSHGKRKEFVVMTNFDRDFGCQGRPHIPIHIQYNSPGVFSPATEGERTRDAEGSVIKMGFEFVQW